MGQAAAWLVQWTGFIALAGLIGAVALDLLVLPARAPELDRPRVHLRRLRLVGILVLAGASAAELLVRSATMSGGAGLSGAATAVPAVVGRTHFGTVWSVRMGLLALLLPTAWVRGRGPLAGAALLSLGLAATVTLTGHAGDWGDLTATAALDWAHLIAAGAWTGGIFALTLLGGRTAARWPGAHLPATMARFSRLAGACLTVVVLTGAFRLWVELPAPSALWRTGYGRILAAKLVLVLALVGCGAMNRYLVLPRLDGRRARGFVARLVRMTRLGLMGPSRARPPAARLGSWLLRESALALAAFWCTAMLVESTPARHASHDGHAESAPAPQRVTMAELHAAGGVPPGWRFSPPPGEAERGRILFARLGCPVCHRVGGAAGPDSAPGPDLAGAGEHHPAGYLLESVINPDAVIVEGPGYTGQDGRSIMPSYADRLTVAELLDLVAYLRTL
ncbi:MAG TPA: CopD family protein [Methylomirabilota bacterium]|nr:CopD family protein [Methylomirabilota bacterium]